MPPERPNISLARTKEPMPDESAPVKPSAVEVFKTESDYLKGDIPEELNDGEAGFGKGSIQLLKNHGTYQQADRDKKKLAPGEKRVKKISFMIRTRIPGGKLTAAQMLAQIDLGDNLANESGLLKQRFCRLLKNLNLDLAEAPALFHSNT